MFPPPLPNGVDDLSILNDEDAAPKNKDSDLRRVGKEEGAACRNWRKNTKLAGTSPLHRRAALQVK